MVMMMCMMSIIPESYCFVSSRHFAQIFFFHPSRDFAALGEDTGPLTRQLLDPTDAVQSLLQQCPTDDIHTSHCLFCQTTWSVVCRKVVTTEDVGNIGTDTERSGFRDFVLHSPPLKSHDTQYCSISTSYHPSPRLRRSNERREHESHPPLVRRFWHRASSQHCGGFRIWISSSTSSQVADTIIFMWWWTPTLDPPHYVYAQPPSPCIICYIAVSSVFYSKEWIQSTKFSFNGEFDPIQT